MHDRFLLRRCLMPGGLLSAISGILAGGILGFGAAVWIVLDTFARSCRDVWWCSFVALQDLLIHWHISCLPQWSCRLIGADFSGVLFAFGLDWFVLFFAYRPGKTSDCVMVRTPLLTPQRGRCFMHLANSFISTTLCDDLARAAEAKDGKTDWQ